MQQRRRYRKIEPSLRRHYPDQVHGCDLSHPALSEIAPRGLIQRKCKEEFFSVTFIPVSRYIFSTEILIMKKILLLCCLISSLFVFAQKTIYDANAVLREGKGYEAIEITDGIDLYISYGEEAIAVSASEAKYRDKIKTVVENGVLKISYDEKGLSWNTRRNLKAYVSFKKLSALAASGGSDINVEGSIKTNELAINISGGCDFKGKVEVSKLSIDQSGGSDINISGTANNVDITASGGSDFNGYSLATEFCTAEASGGSDIEITANKEITAKASGASDIRYKGTASLKDSKSSGGSKVSKGS